MTHYETLHVSPTCTDTELRKAFHSAAKALHPDSQPNLEEAMAQGWAEWEDIEAAYNAIKTPELRAAYDARLLATAPRCKDCRGTGKVQRRKGWEVVEAECLTCHGKKRVLE